MADSPALVVFRKTCRTALTEKFPDKGTIDDVVARMRQAFEVSDEEAEKTITWLEASLGVSMSIGSILDVPDFAPWLSASKAGISWYYWNRYREELEGGEIVPPHVIGSLDQITDRILDHCENPTKEGPWDRRGMVVGHVQSGKTANYTGLICKAADAGYRVIIVIAGIHNKLRNQTQERIDTGFIGVDSSAIFAHHKDKFVGVGKRDTSRRPTSLTSSAKDFNKNQATSLGISVDNSTEPVVFVIKKNAAVLKNLIGWLREHNTAADGQKIDAPLLLIDDEADNASINIAYSKEGVSAINQNLRSLLALFNHSAYVGYTATPFANIFIDPDTNDEMLDDDLFPRDFIVGLDPPTNYVGPNEVFLDASEKFLITINDCEDYLPVSHKIDWRIEELPPSLVDAIRAYVVARAIRILRGDGGKHTSMLVNASRFTMIQGDLKARIHVRLTEIIKAVRLYGKMPVSDAVQDPELAALRTCWTEIGYDDCGFEWSEVQGVLLEAAAPIRVAAINSNSSDPLDYESNKENGLAVIAVGGLALSRGLTLEGLMVTYFHRRSVMYDTLMQMGRWFGYRDGYEDLCRIWMSEETQGWFEHITESVALLRGELASMEAAGAAPKDFGLKVRSHPDSLLITARNKIGAGAAVAVKVALGGNAPETTTVHSDPVIIGQNIDAGRELVLSLGDGASSPIADSMFGGSFLFNDVDVRKVMRFIANFTNHEASTLTQTATVIEYIEARSATTLRSWDVLVVGLTDQQPGVSDDSLSLPVKVQQRTAGSRSNAESIKLGEKQRVASRGIEKAGLSDEAVNQVIWPGENPPDRLYRAVRERPLLMLHLIQVLEPTGDGDKLADGLTLPATPVLAWGISFPSPPDDEPEEVVEYVVTTTWLREQLREDLIDDEAAGDAS
jgi:hypothetical protein